MRGIFAEVMETVSTVLDLLVTQGHVSDAERVAMADDFALFNRQFRDVHAEDYSSQSHVIELRPYCATIEDLS